MSALARILVDRGHLVSGSDPRDGVDAGGVLLTEDLHSEGLQLLCCRIVTRVRAADRVTAVNENPGQSRYANSADTDEVDWCLAVEQARQRRASVRRKISQLALLVFSAEGRIERIEAGCNKVFLLISV